MVTENENLVLRNIDLDTFPPFSLKYGEVAFVMPPRPQKDGSVRFVEDNIDHLYCQKTPCWVKCTAYSVKWKDRRMINAHLEVFKRHNVFWPEIKRVSQRVIDCIGAERTRMMNLLLCRLKGETFIEVPLEGLVDDSMCRLIHFMLSDASTHKVTYIVVLHSDQVLPSERFIHVSKESIPQIMRVIDIFFAKQRAEKLAVSAVTSNRNPSETELAIIRHMACKAHYERQGWDKNLKVVDICNGSLLLIPQGMPNKKRLCGKRISEYHFYDSDGMYVYVALNIDRDGMLFELDARRMDGDDIINCDNLLSIIENNLPPKNGCST